ncbi:MAG: hypothetical protein Q8K36_06285 [Alphaproteobacteria bacterium]|nr:hypothetical protein [Alphaproteobacteria bacterium]
MADAIAISRQSMITARDVETMYAQNATEMQDPNSIKKVAHYTTDHAQGVQATIVESINESLLLASRLS